MTRPASTRGRGERASATVEFALVLPLVLIMTLAVLQVGLLVKDRLVVEEAARAGARQAAVTAEDGAVRQAVLDAGATLDPGLIDVTIAREGGVGTAVAVTVIYHSGSTIPLVDWLLPDTIDLSATVSMRQESG